MNLFHFTRREYLSSILATGLDKGDVPLNTQEGVQGISLTADADASPRIQAWSWIVPEKLRYRLTVQLEPSERLMKWRYVPDTIRMDRAFWKKLCGDPYQWWVYFGCIPPTSIAEIYDTQEERVLTADEIESLRTLNIVRGKQAMHVRWISFEESLVKK
jgi:hypothetical protein